MKHFLAVAILAMIAVQGCKKDTAERTVNRVEIYLLKSFETYIDSSTHPDAFIIKNPVLEAKPLIRDSEISYYEKEPGWFVITKDIYNQVKDFGREHGFAVVVDGRIIYCGYFMPVYASYFITGSATAEPLMATSNKFLVQFAYVQNGTDFSYLDKRNDSALLSALSATGRLR